MARFNIFIILFFLMQNIYAEAVSVSNGSIIHGVRVWPATNSTRIVLDLSSKTEFSGFTLDNPDRLVFDVQNAKFFNKNIVKNIKWRNSQISNIRYSTYISTNTGAKSNKKNNLRLVFDLKNAVEFKAFSLPPADSVGNYRLVIDITNKTKNNPMINAAIRANTTKSRDHINQVQSEVSPPMPQLTAINSYKKKKFTVVIDPGHGGDDPGAIGQNGTQEKDVALAIANILRQFIDQDEDLKAVLTRSGDYFLGLRERTEKARLNQADLFVSIHADGFNDARASGSSVFVLSERGASSELAKWTADQENAADLVGGVKLENKDPMLATVLLDLSQTASNRASYQVANKVLQQIAVVTDLHKARVEKAGFMVLRSPDIPSILVETGFISNPRGERNLSSIMHQRKLAYAVYKGIKSYFKMYPRPSWSDELIHARNN
jgi:N-acetylmuramoyl-L-alanine amidase